MNDEEWAFLRGNLTGAVLGFFLTIIAMGMSRGFYRNGQEDALNGIWNYQKVVTSDGAVHFIEVTTQPSK